MPPSDPPASGRSTGAARLLAALIALYLAAFGSVTALRHYQFQTQTADLGIFIQNIWNASEGRGLVNSLEEVPRHAGVHVSPILYAIALGYRVAPTPYLLLALQTVVLGLGAIPLYALARRILKKEYLALLVVIAYLFSPSLGWLNTYDFHPAAFLVPLIFLALYAWDAKRWALGWIALMLAAATQEGAIPIILMFGILAVLRSFRGATPPEERGALRLRGAAVIALAALYFVVTVAVVMPAAGGGLLRVDRYRALGATGTEIVTTVLTKPGTALRELTEFPKLAYAFLVFNAVGFLPLLSPEGMLLLVPGLLENMATDYIPQFSASLHYDAVVIPGLFLGTIYGLRRLLVRFSSMERPLLLTLAVLVVMNFVIRHPLSPVHFPVKLFRENPHWEAFREMLRRVPDDEAVSVAAHTHLVPHLAERNRIYLLGREPDGVDVVLLDPMDFFGFGSPDKLRAYVDRSRASPEYELEALDDRHFIFKRISGEKAAAR